MNDIITNLMVKYEDSFIMYLINNTTLNELGDWLIGFFVIYFGIKVLNFLINLTIVTSKHFTKRYKLYEKMDLEDMYWKDFLDRAHKRKS